MQQRWRIGLQYGMAPAKSEFNLAILRTLACLSLLLCGDHDTMTPQAGSYV
jgi:hypothetical protein